jgi:DNA-binding LacI/PurR family transcriptional regulator
MNPSVTAVSQPIDDISSVAFNTLMGWIKNDQNKLEENPIYLPIDFIVRESTIKNR